MPDRRSHKLGYDPNEFGIVCGGDPAAAHHEHLVKATHSLALALDDMRAAVAGSSPLEADILYDAIKSVVEIRRRLDLMLKEDGDRA